MEFSVILTYLSCFNAFYEIKQNSHVSSAMNRLFSMHPGHGNVTYRSVQYAQTRYNILDIWGQCGELWHQIDPHICDRVHIGYTFFITPQRSPSRIHHQPPSPSKGTAGSMCSASDQGMTFHLKYCLAKNSIRSNEVRLWFYNKTYR